MCVAERVEFLPRNINFAGPEVGHGYIAHIVADRSIPEHWQIMFCSEDSFFDRFGGLVTAVEFFHALHLIRQAVNTKTNTSVFNH